MDKSTILASLLLLALLAASGCREKCSSDELRYGDKCILRPDSGIFLNRDASDEESIDPLEGDAGDPDDDASTGELEEDAAEPDRDAGADEDAHVETTPAPCDNGACRRKAKQFTYGAPGCAILDDGTLWCWGGMGGSRLPRQIGTATDWQVVSSTDNFGDDADGTPGNHTCAIRSGILYCWGENFSGQLGLGSTASMIGRGPQRVGDGSDWTAVSTSAGWLAGAVTCGIRAGALYCWGEGTGSTPIDTTPVRIGTRDDWTSINVHVLESCGIAGGVARCFSPKFRERPETSVNEWNDWTLVSAGGNNNCGIRLGKLFCWGGNDFGQSGLGVAAVGMYIEAPTQVGTEDDWTFVDSSMSQSCGIRAGELYCWGSTRVRNALDLNSFEGLTPFPRRVGNEADWVDVDVGIFGACGRRTNGQLSCWGSNAHGELGTEEVAAGVTSEPSRIGDADDWLHVATGPTNTCGIRSGQLFCWGAFYDVGSNSPFSQTSTPTRIGAANDWSKLAMHWGADHACGMRNATSVWCWGAASQGRLGPESSAASTEPVAIPPKESEWDDVAVGRDSSCGRDSRELFCWGSGWSGIAQVPEAQELLGTWEAIGATMGIMSGRLVEWTSTSPAAHSTVTTETGWTAFAQGWAHTCGVREGRLYCWGKNDRGQLGLGVTSLNITDPTPSLVPGQSPWLDVVAAMDSTCGLQNDRTLWCWGNNLVWDDPIAPEPVQVPGQWEAIAMSGRHICAIASDGTLWCWGSNDSGQLGLGDDYWTDSPQPVSLPD